VIVKLITGVYQAMKIVRLSVPRALAFAVGLAISASTQAGPIADCVGDQLRQDASAEKMLMACVGVDLADHPREITDYELAEILLGIMRTLERTPIGGGI
jgi:hypothetical protein